MTGHEVGIGIDVGRGEGIEMEQEVSYAVVEISWSGFSEARQETMLDTKPSGDVCAACNDIIS